MHFIHKIPSKLVRQYWQPRSGSRDGSNVMQQNHVRNPPTNGSFWCVREVWPELVEHFFPLEMIFEPRVIDFHFYFILNATNKNVNRLLALNLLIEAVSLFSKKYLFGEIMSEYYDRTSGNTIYCPANALNSVPK